MSQSTAVDGPAARDCAIQSNLRSVPYSATLGERDKTGLKACFGTRASDQKHAREQSVARRIRVPPACEKHDPEKACPALDAGWLPVFGKDHAPKSQTATQTPAAGCLACHSSIY